MSIENLLGVLPPPREPFDAFAGPWEPVEWELGLTLPQDYKDFTRLYGRGYFLEFFGVDMPRSSNPNTRLERNVPIVCAAHRSLWRPDELPYRFWPERGGLLPFGGTDNGDDLFWHTCGEPERWKIVVLDRGHDFEVFDCDLTDFLAGLITGEIVPREFPDLLPCEKPFLSPPRRAWKLSWNWSSH